MPRLEHENHRNAKTKPCAIFCLANVLRLIHYYDKSHKTVFSSYWIHAIISTALWRHKIEAFSFLLVLWEWNPPVIGGFPSQRPVTPSFYAFFDLRLGRRLSKQSRRQWFGTPWSPLWHHCNATFRSCPSDIEGVGWWSQSQWLVKLVYVCKAYLTNAFNER